MIKSKNKKGKKNNGMDIWINKIKKLLEELDLNKKEQTESVLIAHKKAIRTNYDKDKFIIHRTASVSYVDY